MRCTQCDRLAVPQAVGRTPDGRVVFGWCLDCLASAGCTDVVVAEPRATRKGHRVRRSRRMAHTRRQADRSRPEGSRRRLVGVVAALLGAWGMLLVATSVWMRGRGTPHAISPLGNGTPALLLVGGATSVATSVFLGAIVFGASLLRSRAVRRSIHVGTSVLAVVLLFTGIVAYALRRDSRLIAVGALVLVLSASARWLARRLHPAP